MRPALALGAIPLLALAGVCLSRSSGSEVIASFRTTLLGRSSNQRHNALLAIRRLDGAIIQPHATFSFNGRVGSFSRDAGYRRAPVSYNGQLIDAWGGGVCQASTTTYNAALLSGMTIVERTRHHFAPSYVPIGLDAAVAYGNFDLKLQNPYEFPVRIRARVTGESVTVEFVSDGKPSRLPTIERELSVHRPAGLFRLGDGAAARVRNSGKDGYNVSVYRRWEGRRELISQDEYPAMSRVVETR